MSGDRFIVGRARLGEYDTVAVGVCEDGNADKVAVLRVCRFDAARARVDYPHIHIIDRKRNRGLSRTAFIDEYL